MLDSLGQRYGKLPSEVLEHGTTFDLQIYDTAVSYTNWLDKKASTNDPSELYSKEELEEMHNKFKRKYSK
tara:strand:+ start:9362 stop:9571 length:210 start_codon:yes stop_codon:yes gene_type:complete